MKELILSGGGKPRQTKTIDRLLVSHIPKTKKILYIPIAMPPHHRSFGKCFDWIRASLGHFGFSKIDMWTNLNNRKPAELKEYAAIWIGGGNTFSLMNDLRKTGFDKLLLEYIKKGGLVYGGSAGTIIFGKDISFAHDPNQVHLKDCRGFDLANGFSIYCHYTHKKYGKEAQQYVERTGIPVIALSDSTGLHINNNKIKIIGTKPAFIFTGKEIIKYTPGKLISMRKK